MSNTLVHAAQAQEVWRWGGWAGVAGSVLLVAVMAMTSTMIGDDPAAVVGWIERFPQIAAIRVVENGAYLGALVLWAVHVAALSHRLMGARMAPALFGGLLALIGLTAMIASALPHVGTAPLSGLYHAAGAGEAEREVLALMFRGNWAMFDAPLFAGLTVLPLGMVLLALAMWRDAGFGAGWGVATLILGIAGFASAIYVLTEPGSLIAAVVVLGLIIFNLVVGWRLTRVGRN